LPVVGQVGSVPGGDPPQGRYPIRKPERSEHVACQLRADPRRPVVLEREKTLVEDSVQLYSEQEAVVDVEALGVRRILPRLGVAGAEEIGDGELGDGEASYYVFPQHLAEERLAVALSDDGFGLGRADPPEALL